MVNARRLLMRSFALVISLIFLFPYSCYAVETDYISGENIEEIYWSDCDKVININKDDLIGNVKYISDAENSCFYVRINFHSMADDYDAEKVEISFNVSNSVNSYRFTVRNTGENGELIAENNDNFKIYYSFDLYPSKRLGGYIYIGFDFKNKTDKTLNNSISCEYACGDNCAYSLFDSANVDMYKPETQRSTATKKSTTKPRTESADKTKKQTTEKSRSSSKTTVKKSTQTKYAGSNLYTAGQMAAEEESEKYDAEESAGYTEETDTELTSDSKNHLSDTAKKLLIASAVIAAIGVAAVIIGLVTKPTDSESVEK